MHNGVALKALEVSVTNTRRPSMAHNLSKIWLPLTVAQCEAAIGQADKCAEVVYFNSDKELVPFTIVTRSLMCSKRSTGLADWPTG